MREANGAFARNLRVGGPLARPGGYFRTSCGGLGSAALDSTAGRDRLAWRDRDELRRPRILQRPARDRNLRGWSDAR
jgi:hypothetical protein